MTKSHAQRWLNIAMQWCRWFLETLLLCQCKSSIVSIQYQSNKFNDFQMQTSTRLFDWKLKTKKYTRLLKKRSIDFCKSWRKSIAYKRRWNIWTALLPYMAAPLCIVIIIIIITIIILLIIIIVAIDIKARELGVPPCS